MSLEGQSVGIQTETFLGYRNFLWFWLCFVVVVVLGVFYLLDNPVGGRNGGTVLGYTYGGIATAGILYLMWYGIRKRSFYARVSTLRGTLSAHVWIGVALSIIVPLHCGFSFGMNVHTLAYVLMVTTILSGVWGAVMYMRLPKYIYSQRGGGTLRQIVSELTAVDGKIDQLVNDEETKHSDRFMKMYSGINFTFSPSLLRSLLKNDPPVINRKEVAVLLSGLPKEEQSNGLTLISLVNKKRELVCRAQHEARILFWVRLWLYFHLPVSFGLLAALSVHIFSVFYYW